MALQFNRFNKIFSDRESSISLLNSLSRSYSEGITVRYFDEEDRSKINIIFVIFKSSDPGDYEIIYETSEKDIETSFRIFEVTRQYEGQSDLDCINVALFGKEPVNRDMVIIKSISGNTSVTYIYYDSDWIRIGSDGSELNVSNTETVKLTITRDPADNISKTLTADVKIDNETIVYDPSIDKIRVNKIYGGTF